MHTAVWFVDLFRSAVLNSLVDSVSFWFKGVLAVLTVGSLFWLSSLRLQEQRSVTALLGYLFPARMYSHATMKPAYWNLLFSLEVWSPLLILIGSAKLGERIADWLAPALIGHLPLRQATMMDAALQLMLVFLGSSFFDYWLHYAFHKVPLLWSIHRVHHSVETLGITALVHTHPIESLIFGPLLTLPTALVSGLLLAATGLHQFHPAALTIIALYGTWEIFHGIFEHSHIPISFGWFNRIYAGAVLHQIHHSAELRHRDKNLGIHFGAIWDWLFGTIYLPAADEQYRWGLNEEELGEKNPHLTVREFYFEPFAHARRAISGRRRQDTTAAGRCRLPEHS